MEYPKTDGQVFRCLFSYNWLLCQWSSKVISKIAKKHVWTVVSGSGYNTAHNWFSNNILAGNICFSHYPVITPSVSLENLCHLIPAQCLLYIKSGLWFPCCQNMAFRLGFVGHSGIQSDYSQDCFKPAVCWLHVYSLRNFLGSLITNIRSYSILSLSSSFILQVDSTSIPIQLWFYKINVLDNRFRCFITTEKKSPTIIILIAIS